MENIDRWLPEKYYRQNTLKRWNDKDLDCGNDQPNRINYTYSHNFKGNKHIF